MTFTEWEQEYYRLVGHHTVLQMKAADGLFDPAEWHGLIAEMRANSMWALANDVYRELTNQPTNRKD
jgi:hypothetical protein